jgi:hypothetical protein
LKRLVLAISGPLFKRDAVWVSRYLERGNRPDYKSGRQAQPPSRGRLICLNRQSVWVGTGFDETIRTWYE